MHHKQRGSTPVAPDENCVVTDLNVSPLKVTRGSRCDRIKDCAAARFDVSANDRAPLEAAVIKVRRLMLVLFAICEMPTPRHSHPLT